MPPGNKEGKENSRGTSIKTRIETWTGSAWQNDTDNSRGTSIKTRIETIIYFMIRIVRILNSRGTSIKTRIETWQAQATRSYRQIQEAHPLKQGLKPLTTGANPVLMLFKRHIH